MTISGSVATGSSTLALAGSGATTISGVIGGSGGVTAAGSGLVVLSASNNTYTGSTTVNGGTLSVTGSGTILGSVSIAVNSGGQFLLDSSATNVLNRVSDSTGVTLSGGTISMLGNNSAPTSETVGNLTLGPGVSAVTISHGVAGHNARLTFGSNKSALSGDLSWTANIGSMVNFTAAIPGQGGPGDGYYGGWITQAAAPADLISFGGAAGTDGNDAPSCNEPAAWMVVNGHAFARYSSSHGVHEETANSAGNIKNFAYELARRPPTPTSCLPAPPPPRLAAARRSTT